MVEASQAISARPSKFYRERTSHPLVAPKDSVVPKEFTHIKVTDLPDFVQEGSFIDTDYNTPIRFRYAIPPVVRGTVVTAITGLKENINFNNERMRDLYDQGIPFICLELPNVGNYTNFFNLYLKYSKFFLLHEDSPVHKLFPGLDKEIEAHSTGGLIALKLALQDEPEQIKRHFKAVFADAPFTDNPNSSEQDGWLAREIFTLYAKHNRHKLVEQTYFGNFYMIDGDIASGKIQAPSNPLARTAFTAALAAQKMAILWSGGQPWEKDADGLEGHYRLPTYGQILELREVGRALKKFLVQNPDHAKNHIPITIYSDLRDRFSSHKSTAFIANLVGANLVVTTGFHNNLNNDDQAAAHFLGSIESRLQDWPAPQLTIENNPPAWPLPKISADSVTLPKEYLKSAVAMSVHEPVADWTDRLPLPKVFKFPVETPAFLLRTATDFLQRTFSRSADKDYSHQNAKLMKHIGDKTFYIDAKLEHTSEDLITSAGQYSASAIFNGYSIPDSIHVGTRVRPARIKKKAETLELQIAA